MTIADQVLETLNDRKMTLVSLGVHLKMNPGRTNRELRPVLEDLHRQKRLMIVGNEWTVTKRANGKAVDPEAADELPEALVNQLSKSEQERLRPGAPETRNWRATMKSRDAADNERRRILQALANGPMKRIDLHRALGGDVSLKTIANRLDRLRKREQIVKTKAGYALPSATVADALDVRVPVTISTCGIAPDAPPRVVEAIKEMAIAFVNGAPEPAPKFTESRPLSDVTLPPKFDEPKGCKLLIEPSANGFIVSSHSFASTTSGPSHVFNRFDDLVSHLRKVYFG
jgi:hypothetical protein